MLYTKSVTYENQVNQLNNLFQNIKLKIDALFNNNNNSFNNF